MLFLLQTIIAANQIQFANWMGQMSLVLNDRMLNQIDLPGAHHAGFLSTALIDKVGELFSKCQKLGITDLLDQGNRYLDLRIGEMHNTLYFTHTVASKQRLDDGLQEINTWIRAHPSEILVLDIVNDDDFKPLAKTSLATQKLPNLLEKMFGDLRISSDEYRKMTFSQLIAANKRIAMVGSREYSNNITKISSWSKTKSGNWGKVVDNSVDWINTDGLNYIKDGYLTVVSASITPTIGQDISPPIKVTKETHNLLRKRLSNISGRLGIIEMDFVEDETVEMIIKHNRIQS